MALVRYSQALSWHRAHHGKTQCKQDVTCALKTGLALRRALCAGRDLRTWSPSAAAEELSAASLKTTLASENVSCLNR